MTRDVVFRQGPFFVVFAKPPKSIIICELHTLNDVALDTVDRFAKRLGALADPDCTTPRAKARPRASTPRL